MEIVKEEKEMSFVSRMIGEKSRHTILTEDYQGKHGRWHTQTLATGRIRKWHANDLAKLVAAVAVLTAGEKEPGDPETGELRDLTSERATVAELQSKADRRARDLQVAIEKEAELRIAKDKAAGALDFEQFLRGGLTHMEKTLIALHAAHQEVLKHPLGAEFALPWLDQALVDSWTAAKDRLCNPAPKPEPDPCSAIVFTRNYSAGPFGPGFVPGDCSGFDREKCAQLIAQGFAVWRTPTEQGTKLVEAAKRELAKRPTYEGPRVDLGWQSAASADE
jgi:hypothetical protein